MSAAYHDAMKTFLDKTRTAETQVPDSDNKPQLFKQLSSLLFRTDGSSDASMTESVRFKRADCAVAFMSAYQAFCSQDHQRKKCVDGGMVRQVIMAWLEGERSTQVQGALHKVLQEW